MQKFLSLFGLIFLFCSCFNTKSPNEFSASGVSPLIVDPNGGSVLTIKGKKLSEVTSVVIGGLSAERFEIISDESMQVWPSELAIGEGYLVKISNGKKEITLKETIESWSPAQIEGARLFDANYGITSIGTTSTYEWQKLTSEISPDWIQRDGNTLTYLPSTGKFWMVGGWNGYTPPDGFDYIDPNLGLPPHCTTNEVWSSPDGISWVKELADNHSSFERRHSHATLLWKDKLWIIGGDWWQQKYNHDVVSSANGINWNIEVSQTPWKDRALLVAGIFQNKMWMVGGQDLDGTPRDEFVYHNDVWNSVDGINWVQVAADAPESETRWSGRGILNDLVEFKGRMWLVGGGRYRDDVVGSSFFQEVWSTTDGMIWKKHTTPPWSGRIWHDVRVFDGKMWLMFGNNNLANLNETWSTTDGETWIAFNERRNLHPGSHAQGLAVTEDFMLYAGGNYSFGLGPTIKDTDKSVWKLKAIRGDLIESWQERGSGNLTAYATGAERPVLDNNAFGNNIAGVQFDGADTVLKLLETDFQNSGRSVFWVGRAQEIVSPLDWYTPPLLSPLLTVVGDGDAQYCAAGLGDGKLYYTSSSGVDGWVQTSAGSGLQSHDGKVRMMGFTHDSDGSIQGWVDGKSVGNKVNGGYSEYHGWSRLGAGGYGPITSSGYMGALGAIIILPKAIDDQTIKKIYAWSQGRFGVK